uniref:IF rod domain-containing protein n=1 Tax=Eptatretus burgeri TaxID=7764 RepID=A0A8C4NE37_EPTBU
MDQTERMLSNMSVSSMETSGIDRYRTSSLPRKHGFSSQSLTVGSRQQSSFSSRTSILGGGSRHSFQSIGKWVNGGFSSGSAHSVSSAFSPGYGSGASRFQSMVLAHSEKETLQQLNDRLDDYLKRVRSLESYNSKIEMEIKHLITSYGPEMIDWESQEKHLEELRVQLAELTLDNANLSMQAETNYLSIKDFQIKLEIEQNLCHNIEMDINEMRKEIDSINLNILELEGNNESLVASLVMMKKQHKERVKELKANIAVEDLSNVQVDSIQGMDLLAVLTSIREEYNRLSKKNEQDAEVWYREKIQNIKEVVGQGEAELNPLNEQLHSLRQEHHNLQLTINSSGTKVSESQRITTSQSIRSS